MGRGVVVGALGAALLMSLAANGVLAWRHQDALEEVSERTAVAAAATDEAEELAIEVDELQATVAKLEREAESARAAVEEAEEQARESAEEASALQDDVAALEAELGGDDGSQEAPEEREALQRGAPDGLPSQWASPGLPMPVPSAYVGANPHYEHGFLIEVSADVTSEELAEWWLAQSSNETWEWTINEDAGLSGDFAHPDAVQTLSAMQGTGGEGSVSATIEITTPDSQGVVVALAFAG